MTRLREEGRLFWAAEELTRVGSFWLDIATGELETSIGLHRIWGFSPDHEITLEDLYERMHPDDVDGIRALMETVAQRPADIPPSGMTAEFRAVLPGGDRRDLRFHAKVLRDDEDRLAYWVGAVRDVTEELLTERERHAQYAVWQALREWEGFEEGVVDLLRRLGTALDFPVATLWLHDSDRDVLERRAVWFAPELMDAEEAGKQPDPYPVAPGEGVVGRVWKQSEPIMTAHLGSLLDDRGRAFVDGYRLRSAVAFPALDGGRCHAVIACYGIEPRRVSDDFAHTLNDLGYRLGRYLDRRQALLAPQRLSMRELEVLTLASLGRTGPQIAQELFLSPATVKTHFEHVYEKLGVGDRAAAVAHALRTGLIS